MGQAESKQEMFWEACGFGRAHLVQKFIEHGIDVNWVSTIHDCCPIHVASQGKADVVKLLIDANCDIMATDSRGNTALHHAAMKGHADIVEMLVEAGADLNSQDKNGWTPLHSAAYFAHLRVVEVLLKHKCDVNLLNKDGRSALVETARSKCYDDEQVLAEIARQLIHAGCDVNLKCADLGEADFTGLMFAAYHDHSDVANIFIDGGCDLNAASLYATWTAMHWAVDLDNRDMVYLLLEAGADPTRASMRGELPADRAKDPALKEFLLNATNIHKEAETVETASLSSVHSVNAQASMDTAKALESLSCHAKNRDILSAPMPSIPTLGISSRTDPKSRYTRRSVKEVAIKSLNTNFPWKAYSKQGSPAPDGAQNGEDKAKMFPSQDDKTNAFMDNLAQRINYMTNRIATLSKDGKGAASDLSPTQDKGSHDSGLSTRDGSQVTSELNTPDDDGSRLDNHLSNGLAKSYTDLAGSPRSPVSPETASNLSSPKKGDKGDKLDREADADLIEESNRGFSILRSLQERRRRSICLEDAAVIDDITARLHRSVSQVSLQDVSAHLEARKSQVS